MFEAEGVGFIQCVFGRLWVGIMGRKILFSYEEKGSNCHWSIWFEGVWGLHAWGLCWAPFFAHCPTQGHTTEGGSLAQGIHLGLIYLHPLWPSLGTSPLHSQQSHLGSFSAPFISISFVVDQWIPEVGHWGLLPPPQSHQGYKPSSFCPSSLRAWFLPHGRRWILEVPAITSASQAAGYEKERQDMTTLSPSVTRPRYHSYHSYL